MWSVDPLDWYYRDSKKVEKYVLDNMEGGSIILLHDIHKESMEAALKLIPEIRKRGFQIVSLSQMAKYKKNKIKKQEIYFHFSK